MTAYRFLGIDPGKQGAIASIDDDSRAARVVVVPTIAGEKGSKVEYSLTDIRDVLVHHAREVGGPMRLFVTLEKSQPMPPLFKGKQNAEGEAPANISGTIANFNRGVCRGYEWMLVALGIPYQLVAPRSWQAVMHVGTPGSSTKQRSIMAAQRLFPSVSLLESARCRVAHDGMAEALLIAEYGRRALKGELPAAKKGKRAAEDPSGDLFADGGVR